jgi:hypothetical protein
MWTRLIGRMAQLKPFQGDDWFDLTGYGERCIQLHDALLAQGANPSADALQLWQQLGLALAKNGIHLNVHAQLRCLASADARHPGVVGRLISDGGHPLTLSVSGGMKVAR